jgi:hypothetical protein
MAARRLLYEEQIGTHLRSKENQQASDYARSVALLKRHGQQET